MPIEFLFQQKAFHFSRYPHVPWDFTSVESYKEGSEPEQNDVNALLASPSNEKNANTAETNGKANGVETEVKYKLAMTKVFISWKFKTIHTKQGALLRSMISGHFLPLHTLHTT